jgi:hypothetical protein
VTVAKVAKKARKEVAPISHPSDCSCLICVPADECPSPVMETAERQPEPDDIVAMVLEAHRARTGRMVSLTELLRWASVYESVASALRFLHDARMKEDAEKKKWKPGTPEHPNETRGEASKRRSANASKVAVRKTARVRERSRCHRPGHRADGNCPLKAGSSSNSSLAGHGTSDVLIDDVDDDVDVRSEAAFTSLAR